jgi:hypothetical protein
MHTARNFYFVQYFGGGENMGVVYCVMDSQDKVFAIYKAMKRAEAIAEQMKEKYKENYYVTTWQIH